MLLILLPLLIMTNNYILEYNMKIKPGTILAPLLASGRPKATPKKPNGAQMAPQRTQMEPKEDPKGAKGAQCVPKGAQMEPKREPKEAQRHPQGPQRHLNK